ncbi:hypothetical protein KABACHOK_01200 [Brevundimonas phage vB_BpoS-Kabachok]|uniref:Uncharacterized protein n=1 Tax=Brevundimonas phage vB_BpoS-Kabachok TaxID=2948600 RepID=A0A9E7MQN6_9CAUD|nr:hypothetical protein KABACHOK_01200 [Brevundimonas phage vB_BpoS-Kabachok]
MKMHITREWLLEKIKAEPDDACCEAGVLHPEAPIPAMIARLTPASTDLEVIDVITHIEAHAEPYRGIFRKAACEVAGITSGVYDSLRQGAAR